MEGETGATPEESRLGSFKGRRYGERVGLVPRNENECYRLRIDRPDRMEIEMGSNEIFALGRKGWQVW
jgi:hypothetical protein